MIQSRHRMIKGILVRNLSLIDNNGVCQTKKMVVISNPEVFNARYDKGFEASVYTLNKGIRLNSFELRDFMKESEGIIYLEGDMQLEKISETEWLLSTRI